MEQHLKSVKTSQIFEIDRGQLSNLNIIILYYNIINMGDSFIYSIVTETRVHIVLNLSLRDFTTPRGTSLGQIEFNVHLPVEFIQAVWDKSVNHIQRGIIFRTNDAGELSCSWMDESNIVINNIGNCLQLYDTNSHTY